MPDAFGHSIHSVTVGSGDPAVMIHCMLGRHQAMLPLAKALNARATLLDMPGHGRSDKWDGKTEYQSLVAEAARQCCDGPSHVIGHSFGATAALRLAIESPECVSRLTLIEPVFFAAAKGTAAFTAHMKAFRPFITAMLMGDEPCAAEMFNAQWSDSDWAALSERQKDYLIRRIHLVVAGGAAIEEDADGVTSAARLGALDIPVTLIRGGQTQPVIKAIHDALVARIPQATDHVIEEAGHMIALTHVAQIAAIIRAADQETG
ncbi:pimeloyl-ACP methyl ester carboxylesterase [Loktanella sp. PT4BL]|jgi:pimeloyl-ACP methyl ester carboxylesterase|uniref:alpha/beta fold hydrolase n=1 Tax=Loktanella sp. PT4BL TaxID=2135611 RepID=UPI000D753CA9|nr:alpha/beta hydrolase [Loktanella sp. PT4BL]PXW72185.1 pimeloyl-ACP methyl ester carboxylesterase [Loktanella sp. PT4BL]